MSTSQYNYAPYHPIGAASLLVWDEAAGPDGVASASPQGAWRSVGQVADAAVVMTAQAAEQALAMKGLSMPVAQRPVSQRYSLSFRLLEHAGPETLDLLFGLGAAQDAADSALVSTSEVLRLYAGDWHELAHPFGIAQALPAGVTGLSGSAGGTGGAIVPGTYYYWVVPLLPGDGGVLAQGSPAAAGSVAVGGGEKVTLSFTPPASYTPAGYAVYMNTVASLAAARVVKYTASATSPIVVGSHPLGYYYGAPAAVRLTSYDGSTEYVAGTDFELDAGKGLVRRISGGAIPSGSRVVAVYTYTRPASVVTQLGDPVALERYRRVKLLQLAPEATDGGEPDPALWRETGVEWELHRVCIGSGGSGYGFTPDEFSPGAAVAWDCMYDPAYARVGVVRSTYGVLAEYA